MSTPYNYIESTGVIVPDVSDIQMQVEGEFKTAFGADIAVTADTPQGKAITAEVTARSRVAQMLAQMANQINPNQAGGVFLDGICAFTGLSRIAQGYTLVPGVVITGQPNSIFLAGQLQAQSSSTGFYYTNVAALQLDASGNGNVNFQCTTAGPNTCPIGDLVIATQVNGWETIDNTTAGAPGNTTQSDNSLRALRKKTLAGNALSTVEAIVSALYKVPGVTSLTFLENIENTTQTIDGITLAPNSIWACVSGGSDAAVAAALLSTKTLGANWNGATSVTVTDSASGQQYTILFDRPTAEPVLARVTMRQGTSTADLTAAVPQALVDYAAGKINDDPGFVVGEQVSPFDLAGAIYSEVPGAFVSKLEVAYAGGSPVFQTTELAIAKNQQASITLSSVQVIIIT